MAPPVFSITASFPFPITRVPVGVRAYRQLEFHTTGVLGVAYSNGRAVTGAFPNWLTWPGGTGLALARDWHFRMAWLFVANGHPICRSAC